MASRRRAFIARYRGWQAMVWLLTCLATGAAAAEPDWRPLFDGRELGQWRPTAFGGEGEVAVVDGVIHIAMGSDMSGITWAGDFPRNGYEIDLQARRDEGVDFFCGLTFPVGHEACSFIVGGWGGMVVGLSSIDGHDASENETTQTHSFDTGRWYRVRVRVTPARIECFLDGAQVVDQAVPGHLFSIRDEMRPAQPLGIATYATTASLREIRWRPLEKP